jgi:LysM repeat protein
MGKILLPIPPAKMQTTINNQNKSISLMNEGEVNILKSPGLTTIKFDILLPLRTYYPFAMYKNKVFQPAGYYLEYFERLKRHNKTFQFIISRWLPTNGKSQNVMKTSITVTLENYVVTEDVDNAPDISVSLELKEYVKYQTVTKVINLASNTVSNASKTTASSKTIPNTYIVKKGDTLWAIAKKLLGDGAKCWNLAKLNGISNPNKLSIGQVLKIQDVKATTGPVTSKGTGSGKSTKVSANVGSKPATGNKETGNILFNSEPRSSGGGGISDKGYTHSGGGRSFEMPTNQGGKKLLRPVSARNSNTKIVRKLNRSVR